jgi:hypothetical protein
MSRHIDPDLHQRERGRALLKGNSEAFTMRQSHAFSTECRGLGVAEMAYHALEVLHSIVKSSETKSNQTLRSTFEKTPPIPRGYSGQAIFGFVEETEIAL